jgi:uncharacterized protein (DUF58 family)
MLNRFKALTQSLEHRIATPSYSGGLLLSISLFFFIAATNTMAGWLYVMSGLILAMVSIAIFSVRQALRGMMIERPTLEPVQAGDALKIHLVLQNNSAQPKALLQVIDHLPPGLSQPHTEVVTQVPARQEVKLQYDLMAHRRGIYRWQRVQIRTGAPLGLVWASRVWQHPIQAIVHPRVLPLIPADPSSATAWLKGQLRVRPDRCGLTAGAIPPA